MDIVLLLTGCINPNGMAYTSLNDKEERKRQYVNAIRHYLIHTDFPTGEFVIERAIELPEILSRGVISVDLILHHPMVEYLLKAPNCCILETMGYQKGFGSAMNLLDNGIIGLNDK